MVTTGIGLRGRRLAAMAALGILAAASPLQAAGTNVSATSSFVTNTNVDYLSKFGSVGHSLINQVYSDSVGGINCVGSACAGAYLSWAVGANIGAFANASITNSLQAAYIGSVTTTVGSFAPGAVKVGEQFVLANSATVTDGVQLFGKGRVTANVGANLFLGGELLGDACFGLCLNPDPNDRIYNLGVGSSKTINVFSYDSATNSASFLGQSQSGVLPKDFQSDDCNDLRQSGCLADRLVEPVLTQRRMFLDADGLPQFSFSTDFTIGDRLSVAPLGVYAGQSGMEQLERRLTVLPFSDYSLASLPAVPEPSSWTMLILGFGLVGTAARRRRQPLSRQAA